VRCASTGCFWGTELHFQRVPGVIATCVGYTQGNVEKPTYNEVCSGSTGHTEGIQVIFDPKECKYTTLCETLLKTVDATLLNQVGNDRGTQYRHGIYPHTDEQVCSFLTTAHASPRLATIEKCATEACE